MSFLLDQFKPTLAGLERAAKADGNDLAAMMSPDHWKLAAQGAGTTIPSPATAKAAITQLQKLWDAHAPGSPPQ